MKKIDLDKSVYQLTEEYPKLINILKELGFGVITNRIARKTIGKIITIPEGCKKQEIDLNKVIKRLKEKGFEVDDKKKDNKD